MSFSEDLGLFRKNLSADFFASASYTASANVLVDEWDATLP
jgi:hypothetical protein